MAAPKYEHDAFESFHDQERVSRISGIVPSPKRRRASSLRIVPPLAPSLPPTLAKVVGNDLSFFRELAPFLRAIVAFLALTVVVSAAYYL